MQVEERPVYTEHFEWACRLCFPQMTLRGETSKKLLEVANKHTWEVHGRRTSMLDSRMVQEVDHTRLTYVVKCPVCGKTYTCVEREKLIHNVYAHVANGHRGMTGGRGYKEWKEFMGLVSSPFKTAFSNLK